MAGASRPKTRSVTDYWMVGQENPVLPVGVLPTHRDILKEVLYKRSLPENKSLDQLSLVSCNFLQFVSNCYGVEGCSNKSDDQKWRYQEAGTETINDRSIAKKIELLNYTMTKGQLRRRSRRHVKVLLRLGIPLKPLGQSV